MRSMYGFPLNLQARRSFNTTMEGEWLVVHLVVPVLEIREMLEDCCCWRISILFIYPERGSAKLSEEKGNSRYRIPPYFQAVGGG